ncbi:hypothetical protein AZE42_11906 [Rhizopogon vesiculosus]|uniref:Uncharacterized protein n=1 Tax=Rhizopogon vesiculosus TaxID=180088 RepID=A0A1J8QAC7_9AGAM|nr:hypothetical protein AZE42_11906 [Rhizopogon vesiculosus]
MLPSTNSMKKGICPFCL